MRRLALAFSLLLVLLLAGCHSSGQSPYAGQEGRDIKALSEDEIAAYLGGEGMGLSKVAELNGYPGPKHVLELADQLELTADQRVAVQDSWDRMHRQAVDLGTQIVEAERELDRLFAQSTPAAGQVAGKVEEIGALSGRLRMAHVAAHLEMKETLSQAQVQRYVVARGYGEHHH